MKSRMAWVVLLALSTAAFGQSAQDSFNKLKSLEGNWTGKTTEGQAVQVSYRVMSGGSAVMSEIKGHGGDMISMFTVDGDRLLMTHYCAAGNQPRMAMTGTSNGRNLTFNYVDATNLLPSQPGHMQEHTIKFIDATHYSEEWNFAVNDGSKKLEVFDLQRAN